MLEKNWNTQVRENIIVIDNVKKKSIYIIISDHVCTWNAMLDALALRARCPVMLIHTHWFPPFPPLPLSSLHPYTQPLKIGYLELRFCYCFLSFLYIGIGDIKKK